MIIGIKVICLVIACVLFAIGAFWSAWASAPKINVMSAGLFFFAVKDLFP